jgi:hypothetical protein
VSLNDKNQQINLSEMIDKLLRSTKNEYRKINSEQILKKNNEDQHTIIVENNIIRVNLKIENKKVLAKIVLFEF